MSLLVLLIGLPAISQLSLDYYLPADVAYSPDIPTPESFFGFQIGEWHLRPDQIDAYMNTLAAVSDRITLEVYGRTHEQRPLVLATITSAQNHSNIQTIKQRHTALSDPATSPSLDIERMPVVVWLGYSIHGNEPSGSNASVLVAYYLAAATGPAIEKRLSETIILLVPSINPDGLSRFAHWANSHKGKNLVGDPSHREHLEAWPGGRTNHYWFDLNRDWMPVQQPESQGRLAKYYEWRPNVLTDHHEMGTNSTFFFQPGIPSRNNPLTPRRTIELTEAIAQYHARALDRIGSLYYTKESYDDFYIGKGSSYPDITGCVGILFEQASSRGHLQESIYGDLSFPFTIRNQVATSLSTLQAAQNLRKELLAHQRDFYSSALREAERAQVKAYIFGSRTDPARSYHFLDILLRHGIRVHRTSSDFRKEGLVFDRRHSFIVTTHQPQFRLITSLFERRTRFTDSLFYDVSAWTLPLAFDMPYMELTTTPRNLIGEEIAEASFPPARLITGPKPLAYVFEWKHYYSPRALYRLLKSNIRVHVSTKPFSAETNEGKMSFDYGTILIPLGIQQELSDSIQHVLETIVLQDGIQVYGLESGLSSGGIDIGSLNFVPLETPRPLLLVGAGVSPTKAGEVWHLLDHRFDIPVSLVEVDVFNRVELQRYTTIIMVDGNYQTIDSTGKQSFKNWIEKGGTLIAQDRAVEWAVNNGLASATIKKGRSEKNDSIIARRAYADEELYSGAMNLGGAIFEARYDRTHPLFYGYETSRLSVFRANTICLEPSRNPYATPMVYSDSPLLSGYINSEHEQLLKGSAAIIVSRLRSGRTILMSDNPNFRAFWFGTNKIFLNSLFFGSIINPRTATREEQ